MNLFHRVFHRVLKYSVHGISCFRAHRMAHSLMITTSDDELDVDLWDLVVQQCLAGGEAKSNSRITITVCTSSIEIDSRFGLGWK